MMQVGHGTYLIEDACLGVATGFWCLRIHDMDVPCGLAW